MLHPVDYVVFAAALVVSLSIGVYHALAGDRQRNTKEYFHGRRNMGLIPMALSLMMSFVSTMLLIGYPAEIYGFGIQVWLGCWGTMIGMVIASVFIVPVFYPLKLTSVNEYLVLRYESKFIKYFGLMCAVLGSGIITGFVLFGPSTAIEGVSGFPSWASISLSSAVAICYTCIGGFRAVVWTDVFQSCVMFCGLIAVCIQGLISLGGFGRMWQMAGDWGRLNFFDFDPNPAKRMNFYGVIFGNALTYASTFGYQQVSVQRYSSMPSMKRARLSMLCAIPGFITIATLCSLCGLIVFAYYAESGCDPKMGRKIHNYNQVMPYFVADVFDIPVLPGLFMSSLFAASLSTASSSMNSAAANIWADVLRDRCQHMSENRKALINKIIVFIFGIFSFAIALCVDQVRGTMMQAVAVVSSALGGPYAALFVMGLFIPWVNWKGVSVGCVTGFVFAVWVCLGSFTVPKNWQELPSPNNCSNSIALSSYDVLNSTMVPPQAAVVLNVTIAPSEVHLTGLQKLYSISFLWIREVITAVTIVTSIIVSLITGVRHPSSIPHNLVHPCLRRCFKFDNKEATANPWKATQMEFNNVEHTQEEAVDIAPKDDLDTAPNADIDDANAI